MNSNHLYRIIIIGISMFSVANTHNFKNEYNLIILINGNLEIGSISRAEIITLDVNNVEEKFEVVYEPGVLTIDNADYSKLLSDTVKSMIFKFIYYDQENVEGGGEEFEVLFNRNWFLERYTILKIYSLEIEEYNTIYYPIEDKSYTYDVLTPNPMTSIIRVKKE